MSIEQPDKATEKFLTPSQVQHANEILVEPLEREIDRVKQQRDASVAALILARQGLDEVWVDTHSAHVESIDAVIMVAKEAQKQEGALP